MTKALISIDYTEDFVADSGKLTAGAPAQARFRCHQQGNLITEEITSSLPSDAHEENDCFPSRKSKTISSS